MNFGATNQFSQEVQISDCQNWGQKSWIFAGFCIKISMSSELATWTNSQTINTTLEKRKTTPESPRTTTEEHPEGSTGAFDRPAEYYRPKNQFMEFKNNLP